MTWDDLKVEIKMLLPPMTVHCQNLVQLQTDRINQMIAETTKKYLASEMFMIDVKGSIDARIRNEVANLVQVEFRNNWISSDQEREIRVEIEATTHDLIWKKVQANVKRKEEQRNK